MQLRQQYILVKVTINLLQCTVFIQSYAFSGVNLPAESSQKLAGHGDCASSRTLSSP